jgi:hypothetical protein
LLLHSSGTAAPVPGSGLRGILIDEWTEVIPSAQEETAIAFHYDAPGGEAPQAILVAVPSGTGANWSLDDVVATLDETLDLAHMRTVDLETLGLGQLAPGITLASNAENKTPSTDFSGRTIGEDTV